MAWGCLRLWEHVPLGWGWLRRALLNPFFLCKMFLYWWNLYTLRMKKTNKKIDFYF